MEEPTAVVKKKAKQASQHERAIVYFSHVPHGFYEKEMREFLSQFGTVTNLRLGRSSKTGKSKGYAFVEFLYKDVAKIVVDTMNNYLMFEKLLKCQLVPTERAGRAIFKGKIDPKRPPLIVNRAKAKKLVNAPRSEKQDEKRKKKQAASVMKLKTKLSDYGISLNVLSDGGDSNKLSTPTPGKSAQKPPKNKTPVMEVDDSDEDISLKTPPHVKKIKSRPNSAAATPKESRTNTPVVAQAKNLNKLVAENLLKKGSTPKTIKRPSGLSPSKKVSSNSGSARKMHK